MGFQGWFLTVLRPNRSLPVRSHLWNKGQSVVVFAPSPTQLVLRASRYLAKVQSHNNRQTQTCQSLKTSLLRTFTSVAIAAFLARASFVRDARSQSGDTSKQNRKKRENGAAFRRNGGNSEKSDDDDAAESGPILTKCIAYVCMYGRGGVHARSVFSVLGGDFASRRGL